MSIQKFETVPIWIPNENSGRKMKEFMKTVANNRNLNFGLIEKHSYMSLPDLLLSFLPHELMLVTFGSYIFALFSDNYWEFHKWSVDHAAELWEELWHYSGVVSSKTYDKVIELNVSMEDRPKWFEGAQLNFGENMLKFRDDHVALMLAGEDRDVERVTYKQLYEDSRLYAAAFRKMGLKKGDVVTCYMSNRKEPVIAMIAVTSIGAIWTGGLPLFGPQAYINRVKQVEPKVLLTVDQFPNNKEIKHLLQNIKEIAEGLPSIEKVIIVPSKPESKLKDISGIKNSVFLDDFLNTGYNADGTVPEIIFEQVSFSHPVFINYTSGTTGLPKTIVHGFGGLLPCVRDYWLHFDSDRNDVWFSMSPVGWVSWNMLNHLLFYGVTLVLFEGVPYFITPTYFWDMVDNLKVSKIFITPSTLDEMEAKGYIPTENNHLSSLKMIIAGSSVVKPRNFDFGLKKIKPDLIFSVGCGSTETMGFFLLTEQTLPLHKGEMSSSCLGVGIECLDEGGKPLIGKMGEFTITTPMPSLPLFLWGDYDGSMYKKAYFSKYTGKFTIGDSAIINPVTKGIIICGRSDETLKPKGCRFGSSEVYNIVELFPEIRNSVCVAQYNKDQDERAVLFVKMQEGHSFIQELEKRLRERIAIELSVKHVPEIMLEVPDIPYNVNGKKMEIIVKKIINNNPHNPELVINSECLKYYYNVPELQGF